MDQRKLFADEEKIPPVRVQREGSSAVCFIRTLFDQETTGCANAVLGTMVIPPGQPEPMVPTTFMAPRRLRMPAACASEKPCSVACGMK